MIELTCFVVCGALAYFALQGDIVPVLLSMIIGIAYMIADIGWSDGRFRASSSTHPLNRMGEVLFDRRTRSPLACTLNAVFVLGLAWVFRSIPNGLPALVPLAFSQRGRCRFAGYTALGFCHDAPVVFCAVALSLILREVLTRLDVAQRALTGQTVEHDLLLIAHRRAEEEHKLRLSTERERAMLMERERISTELHHLIGHVVTSSLLQVEAIDVKNTDEAIKPRIARLKETLDGGMRDIRVVLHRMNRESNDVRAAISGALDPLREAGWQVDQVLHLPASAAMEMPRNRSESLVDAVRELATNALKHSDGRHFWIRVAAHPAFDIVDVRDDGSKGDMQGDGIGLVSLRAMARKSGGQFIAEYDGGFHVRMTLMHPAEENAHTERRQHESYDRR